MAFRQLLLDKARSEPKFSAQVFAYEDLITKTERLGSIMEDDVTRLAFQTDFARYGTRLIQVFEVGMKIGQDIGRRTGTKLLAREVLDALVVPLLDDEFDSFANMNILVRLVSTIVDFAIFFNGTCRKDSTLLLRLADKPGFLEFLVSDYYGARVFKALSEEKFFYRSAETTKKICRRLAVLCSSCTGGHQIMSELGRWHSLAGVLSSLTHLKATLDKEYERTSRQNKTHSARGMRKLSIDEKRSHGQAALKVDSPHLTLPDHIGLKLSELGLRLPTSRGNLSDLIDEIITSEIPSLLKVFAATFPCRVCHEALVSSHINEDNAVEISGEVLELPEQIRNAFEQPLFGERTGVWKVLLSDQALKDLRHLAHSGRFSHVETKLRGLSSGAWKNRNLSNLAGSPTQRARLKTPLLTAHCGKGLSILWQIDVGYYEETELYKQLVRVWRIAEKDDIGKIIDHVAIKQRAQRFDRGFSTNPSLDSSGIYIPLEFPGHESFVSSAAPVTASDLRAIELTNKFYALTKPVLDSLLVGNITAEFPFDTSREEVEIIKHFETGTLILGRSGTGKTTCLVYQLLRKYLARRQVQDEGVVRQVLVTRSNVLSEKLKEYTKRLIESQINKPIWIDSEQDGPIDYKEAHLEEDLDLRSLFDIPNEAYPLICSFDQLLAIIGNTLADSDRQYFRSLAPNHSTDVHLGSFIRRSQTVDFNLFNNEYWHQFNPDLTRGIASQLVFSEIMGVIKGSATKETSFLPLNRNQYLNRSCRLAPTFTTENGRQAVYDLYEAYEKKKKTLGDTDGIDRVLRFLRVLENSVEIRRKLEGILEEIYVDEIQDQRCLEIHLLLNLVRNPRGIHFAGDTAQCISKDSTFRFEDIKALFYETFAPMAKASNQSHLAVPTLFTLNKNYRSHQGIISLASCVMKILYTVFPNTVDKLPPEQGQNDGPKPTFFVGFKEDLIAKYMVGLNSATQNVSDFGSEQVILVRDDSMKDFLLEYLKEKAVILTILEAKGMEFEDVLLFGFFSESPCKAGYRSLQKMLENPDMEFDLIKHAEICSELKNLYVAITRPRSRLWVVESSAASAEPLIKIFARYESEPLIDICTPSDPDVEEKTFDLRATKTTDPRRYIERGNELLKRGLYKEALIRFRSGKDERGQTIAQAFIYRQQGIKARGSQNEALFVECFEKALDLFREADLALNVASCLEDLNRFCEAADIRMGMGAGHHKRAAELYIKGYDFAKASHVFNTMGDYESAASALLSGELFNDFTRYLAENRHMLNQKKVKDYSRLVNMLLKQGRIDPELQDLAIESLGTDDEKVKFFKAAGLTQKLAEHYEMKKEFGDAYETLIADGQLEASLAVLARAKVAGSSFTRSDRFKQACLALSTYAKAREFAQRFGKQNLDPLTKIDYVNLHPEACLRIGDWEQFTAFVEKSITSQFDTTPWNFDDTFNMLYAMDVIDLKLLDPTTSMKHLEIFINAARRIPPKLQKIHPETPPNALPESFKIFLGFLSRPHAPEEIIVLEYSPLQGKLPRICDAARAISSGLELISRGLLTLAYGIHEKALAPWNLEWPYLCSQYVISGTCPKMPSCQNKHIQLASSDCERKIDSLIGMASLFASLNNIYYQFGHGELGKHFQGYKRRWLERLLEELTFVSAFEHDPSRIKTAREDICKGVEWRHGIHTALEGLLLFRLNRNEEWEARNSLSSWLDQVQCASWLGPQTVLRFRKAVGWRLINMRNFYEQRSHTNDQKKHEIMKGKINTLDHVSRSLNCLGACTIFASTGDVIEFERNLHEASARLRVFYEHEYTNFYSVVGAFEFLAAYLICMVCGRNSHLLFPKSWIALHLPKIDVEQAKKLTIDQRDILGGCFLLLLDTFMDILEYLDRPLSENFTYTFRFNKSGRQSYNSRMISNRNANFLVICVLNISSMANPPRGFSQTWERMRNAMISLNSMQGIDQMGPRSLHSRKLPYNDFVSTAKTLQSSFLNPALGYKGKDSLLLLSTTSNIHARMAPALAALFGETPILDFKATVTAYSPDWSPHKNSGQDNKYSERYSPREEAAVMVIQRWWRVRYPLLVSHREFLKTDMGKATRFANTIISAPEFRQLPFAHGAEEILLTQGVMVYSKFRRVKEQLKQCAEIGNRLTEDASLSIDILERLQTLIFDVLDQHQTEFNEAFKAIGQKQLIASMGVVNARSGEDAGLASLGTSLGTARNEARRLGRRLEDMEKELLRIALMGKKRQVL